MSGILEMLGLAAPRIDSQGQLDAAKRETYGASAEAEARRRGFPSAEAMINWQRQQEVKGSDYGRPSHNINLRDVPGAIKNHPMHPANMLEYILNAFKGATNGN